MNRRIIARAVPFSVCLLVLLASCTGGTDTTDLQADVVLAAAPLLAIDSCPTEEIPDFGDGGRMYPGLDEGALPQDLVARELVWCHFNDQEQQLVERRADISEDDELLTGLTDRTIPHQKGEVACPAAIFAQPAVFAVAEGGMYRISLPQTPACGLLTATVESLLNANDDRWRIETVTAAQG